MKYIKLVYESIRLAFQELISNKLRSVLSLSGISIGIFCIITIFTGVDFLNSSINNSIKELGQEVIYIQKFPWSMGEEEYPWWTYLKRPAIDYESYRFLNNQLETASSVCYLADYQSSTVKSEKNSASDVSILGVTPSFGETLAVKVSTGRFITEADNKGSKVAVIGSNVAKELFQEANPIGQYFRLQGKRFRVIGVVKDSDNLIKMISFENDILIPHETGRTMYKITDNSEQWVAAKAKDGLTVEAMKDEVRGAMRSSRKLHPTKDDNFAVNRITMILDAIASLNNGMRIAGFFLGIFSLLIGGFGVANIMFVSVRERTKYIGIKKAIGAPRIFILLEFLIESVVLCVIGSVMGLLGVFALVLVVSSVANLEFVLSAQNIILGISISVIIGVVSGFIPALQAARMNPVKAIRS